MELFGIRNSLYVGNYQQVVNEASSFNSRGDAALQEECDMLLYRAHIGLGNYFLVVQKVQDDASWQLRAVKLLAGYAQSPPTMGDKACETLDEWMANPQAAKDTALLVSAATILNMEGKYEQTLKYVHDSEDIELMAVLVQTYLYLSLIHI
eukprot:TRINITY_DN10447_c0_g2_i1.p1 TRINITY_DN10447_c0_g2~~TRINITY_DN10447_c0_g2_i1.p1  ORF type:complete len:151 (-),score=43.38 TRINITY_DN10447_c0_g2_i1:176-628(-)